MYDYCYRTRKGGLIYNIDGRDMDMDESASYCVHFFGMSPEEAKMYLLRLNRERLGTKSRGNADKSAKGGIAYAL